MVPIISPIFKLLQSYSGWSHKRTIQGLAQELKVWGLLIWVRSAHAQVLFTTLWAHFLDLLPLQHLSNTSELQTPLPGLARGPGYVSQLCRTPAVTTPSSGPRCQEDGRGTKQWGFIQWVLWSERRAALPQCIRCPAGCPSVTVLPWSLLLCCLWLRSESREHFEHRALSPTLSAPYKSPPHSSQQLLLGSSSLCLACISSFVIFASRPGDAGGK